MIFSVRRHQVSVVPVRLQAELRHQRPGFECRSKGRNSTLPDDQLEDPAWQRRRRHSGDLQHQQHGHEVQDGQVRALDLPIVCSRTLHHQIQHGMVSSSKCRRKSDSKSAMRLQTHQVRILSRTHNSDFASDRRPLKTIT